MIDNFVSTYVKYIPENLRLEFKKELFNIIDTLNDIKYDEGYSDGHVAINSEEYDCGYSDGYNQGYSEGYKDCKEEEGFNPRY